MSPKLSSSSSKSVSSLLQKKLNRLKKHYFLIKKIYFDFKHCKKTKYTKTNCNGDCYRSSFPIYAPVYSKLRHFPVHLFLRLISRDASENLTVLMLRWFHTKIQHYLIELNCMHSPVRTTMYWCWCLSTDIQKIYMYTYSFYEFHIVCAFLIHVRHVNSKSSDQNLEHVHPCVGK